MIGDPDRNVADLYDMIHENADDTLTVRSVFIIGPALSDDEVRNLFPAGREPVKPDLRVTKQPNR